MFLQKSLILIAIFYITITLSHPTPRKYRKRETKKSKSKKYTSESSCTKSFCEEDTTYPTEEVQNLLKENSLPVFYMRHYEVPTGQRFALHEEHLCHIISKTVTPKRAPTGFGSKEYVVQSNTTQQTVYIEACTQEIPKLLGKTGCLPNGYDVTCQQQYRLIPLWVYDEKDKSLKHTQFKVPSGCTVHFTKSSRLAGLLK
ncbi:uncharacterized protein [Atheta coriaria]|uniref:uncharacterized protein n=1 Tax=Dalotia coriaria TaxID=877792 RepID=UPI0031F3FC98